MVFLSNNGASISLLAIAVKIARKVKTLYSDTQQLPPGPWKLPLIGNLHKLVGSLPHRIMRDLANKHGPLMHLQLGQTSNIVVSSPETAKEALITHGILPWHPTATIGDELFTAKRVKSFESIRQKEVSDLVKYISSNQGSPINLSKKIFGLTYGITSRAAFAKIFQFIIDEHRERLKRGKIGDEGEEARKVLIAVLLKIQQLGELELPLSNNDIKAIIWDIFSGGSETSSTIVDWAMSEMMKNPRVLQKAQNEVRSVCNGKGDVDEANIQELKYLTLVIKETLRLHPSFPLFIPKESTENCEINGYQIPAKTRVIINAWAISRDPNYWNDPEMFYPERKKDLPGILYAIPNIELPLAKLLYHFDWKLPNGMEHEILDMTEAFGVTVKRKDDLILVPTMHKSCIG
ncbi:putative Cytochrome P450 [Hibiscus syriacus]|uniref:Cytochrome P450 n=1 Tax=Hibiscus syriacus TaxID=106335 RepID=A0A6A3C872_HIBSY|nr:putative Cytochrome P450 [Hibiscus syriacus]